jgi:hypothetical protein
MQQTMGRRSGAAPAVIGLILVGVGVAALVVRQLGIDFFEAIGPLGWPFFVIVPGLILLVASIVPAAPKGAGFAVSGSVITVIGALLLYQTRTEHWESWAYAWALIPLAGGVGTFLYGALTRSAGLITSGLWMAGISGVMLVVGAWFFEGIFAGEMRFAEIGNWWPVVLIVVGVAITVGAFMRQRVTSTDTARETPSGPPVLPPDSLTSGGPQPL